MTPIKTSILLLALAAIACSSQPRFHQMSAGELNEYNASRPYPERVSCQSLRHASSHIRKLRCRTLREWAEGNALATMRLNVLDYSGAVYYTPGY